MQKIKSIRIKPAYMGGITACAHLEDGQKCILNMDEVESILLEKYQDNYQLDITPRQQYYRLTLLKDERHCHLCGSLEEKGGWCTNKTCSEFTKYKK